MNEKEIGTVSHYYNNLEVGLFELSATLSLGETIHIRGAHDDFCQIVKSMQINHRPVMGALNHDVVGIKVSHRVHEKDKVYLVPDGLRLDV